MNHMTSRFLSSMGAFPFRPGMVSTAHEQFKKLRVWPEAVECLIIAERNVEAEDMLKDGGC